MKTHVFLLCLFFIPISQCAQSATLKIIHIDSPYSPFRQPDSHLTWEARALRMFAGDQTRLKYLSSLVAGKSFVPVASGRQILQTPSYILKAEIGTPARTLLVALDTSSDVAWIPCSGCVGCSNTAFPFASSTTYKSLGCSAAQCNQAPNPTCTLGACTFNMTYGGSTISASLSQDTIKLAQDPVPSFTFGCIQKVTGLSVPPQGLLGLGRGPLSFLSQTQSLYKSTFSYCLPSFKSINFSGSLRLGPTAQPFQIKTTPLLKNPRRSSLYYVNLVGIRVGSKVVAVPAESFAFNPSTGAGTIFDSGTVFTRLVKPAYIAVRDEFRRRVTNNVGTVTSLGGFDTCYSGEIVTPTITFMFQGMNVTLPTENILLHSSAGSTSCLAMAAAPDAGVNSVLNVIANMQQQNHRILIDVANSRLGVAREVCT